MEKLKARQIEKSTIDEDYYQLQWRVLDPTSHYSKKWTSLNYDNQPKEVYEAGCRGWDKYGFPSFLDEDIGMRCFRIVQKRWRGDPECEGTLLRLVHIVKHIHVEVEQIVQN